MATLDITGLGYSHDELVVDTFDDLYPDGDNKIYKMATSVLVLDEQKTYVKTGDIEDQSKDTGWIAFSGGGGGGGTSYPTTIKFQSEDGEAYTEVGFKDKGSAGKPIDPDIPSGYTVFDGWFDEEDVRVSFPYIPSSKGEHVLTSKFTNGGVSLAEDSWEQIAYIATNKLSNTYTVGDSKQLSFTYGGVDYFVEMQLVGKNHDYIIHCQNFIGDGNTTVFTITDKPSFIEFAGVFIDDVENFSYSYNQEDGTITLSDAPSSGSIIKANYTKDSTAELTFISKGLPFTNQINSTNTNSGGWGKCSLRAEMNSNLLNSMPSSIKNSIKLVGKIYDIGDRSSTLKTSSDKMWIPSWEELGGGSYRSYVSGQGTKYDVFSDNTSRMKGRDYYIRSTDTAYNDYYWYIAYNGGLEYYRATNVRGIPVCFCL